MRERPPNAFGGAGRPIRDERGFVLPASMFMMLAAFAIVTVGVVASIHAQSGTTRDERSKSALQAAQAGVNQALLRYNTYSSTSAPLTAAFPCVGAGGTRAATTSGWCSGVAATVSGGTATYYVRPVLASGTLEVVSVGTVSGVTRRVDVTALSSSGQSMFSTASVLAQNLIAMDANAIVKAGAQSGGDITMSSNSGQCGNATVGVGNQMMLSGNAAYYSDHACTTQVSASTVGHDALTLPPVNQGDAASSNDNARITNAAAGSGTPADLVSGNRADLTWSAATRQLTIDHNSALTLTGTKYSLCKLTLLQNSAIYVAAGLTVTIFFDSPEACGLTPTGGTVQQLSLSSNSRITYATGAPSSVALLFVGSPTIPTSMLMSSNTQVSGACVQNFVVYAPRTDVTLNSNSQYCGSVAGKTIHLNSNALVQTDSSSSSFVLPNTPPHYVVSRFIECSAVNATPPNSGC